MQAYQELQMYSESKLEGMEHATSDLRQTALAQMLRLHSKKMFKFGSSDSTLRLTPQESENGEEDTDGEKDT